VWILINRSDDDKNILQQRGNILIFVRYAQSSKMVIDLIFLSRHQSNYFVVTTTPVRGEV
jgi:hypothetical protein